MTDWYIKHPDSELDYTIDWSAWITTGDYITASTWDVDTGLTKDNDTFTTTGSTIWVSGGTADSSYTAINTITTHDGRTEVRAIVFYVVEEISNLYELLPELRLHLGDTDDSSYRYMDNWLLIALVSSVNALQMWWNSKYIADPLAQTIARNPNASEDLFTDESPPVIQLKDRIPIILMASILVKSGQLEKNSWSVGSWRDAEIAVSTIEGNRAKTFSYTMDWELLQMYIKPPQKRLYPALRIPFPEQEEETL